MNFIHFFQPIKKHLVTKELVVQHILMSHKGRQSYQLSTYLLDNPSACLGSWVTRVTNCHFFHEEPYEGYARSATTVPLARIFAECYKKMHLTASRDAGLLLYFSLQANSDWSICYTSVIWFSICCPL